MFAPVPFQGRLSRLGSSLPAKPSRTRLSQNMTFAAAKAAADSAWKEKKYSEAAEHYSDCVEYANSNDDKKIAYSNRSGCYLQLKNYAKALIDADECIKLDGSWAKGYVRKGDCLDTMGGKTKEAYNAYNTALRYDQNNKSYEEKRDKILRKINNANTNNYSNNYGTAFAASSGYPTSAIGKFQNLGSVVILIAFLVYFIPFTGYISIYSWRVFLIAAMVNKLLSVYNNNGMIQFDMAYLSRVLADPETMYLMLCSLLVTNRPYPIAGAAIWILELTKGCTTYFFNYVKKNLPSLSAQLAPMIAKYYPQMNVTPEMLQAACSPQALNHFNSQIIQFTAQCEVMQGIYVVFELLLPSRNILFTCMWWKFLEMRYILDRSGNVKIAFASVDGKINSLLSHRMCPGLLRTVYSYIKQMLTSQINASTNTGNTNSTSRGGLSSLMSKCNIM